MIKIIRKLLPKKVKDVARDVRNRINGELFLQKAEYIKSHSEMNEIVEHIKKYDVQTFPYDFRLKYSINMLDGKIFYSYEYQRYYINYEGVDIYLKQGWNEEQCRNYFLSLLIEQDELSPHCYKNMRYDFSKTDIVVDAGGGRRNFYSKYFK